jgi:hypothetical protein
MASSLRVNAIVPASGTNVAIGTAGGTITYNASVSGISTFSSGIIGNVTGNVNATGLSTFTSGINVGTGASISSPATNVLTLGTNNVERVRIGSTGNIGIGTDNPATELEVLGTGTVASFRGKGGNSFIGIKDEDDGTLGFIGVDGGSIKLQTSGSSYADKLVIDSSGRVTTPYQPAFSVSRQNGASDTGSHNVPQFTTEFFNIGNHFSLSTQRFTAPVSGTYLFTGHVIPTGLAQNSGFELWIAVNSSTVPTARRFLDRKKKAEADSNTFSVGGSVVIYLAQNDWVQLTTTTASYSDETNCKFSGYLVG